jgi:hypothetical protein
MENNRYGIGLPITALGLDLAPILIFFLASIIRGWSPFTPLSMLLFPIAGLVTGIVTLTLGKGKISKIGKILAIIAVSLPVAFVAFILIIFIGVVTGVILLM